MTRETRTLIARRHLGEIGLEAFVDWAVFMLEAGHDTEHLRMLASLGHHPDSQDIEYYFEQTIRELGWVIPVPKQAIFQYAQDIGQDILDGTIPTSDGAARLYNIYKDLDHPSDMDGWLYLCDDLDPDTYEELEGDEWEAALHREARRLLGQEAKPSRSNTVLHLTSTTSASAKIGRLAFLLGLFRRN